MKTIKLFQSHSSLAAAFVLLVALLTHLAAPSAFSATYYWDANSTTAGFGNTTGTWGTSAFWTLTAGGGSPHSGVTATLVGDTVNFGSATLNYTNAAVGILAGGVTATRIIFGAGQTTDLTVGAAGGGTITLGGTTRTIQANSSGHKILSPIVLTGATTNILNWAGGGVDPAPTFTLGAMSGTGGLILKNIAGGNPNPATFILNGASTYSGNTTLDSDTINASVLLRLDVNNALPITTVLTIDGGAGDGSGRTISLNLNGKNQTLAGLSSVITGDLRDNRVYSGSAATLTIDGSGNSTYGGLVGSGGTSISIVKQGAGTFTLTNANTYTGTTTINGGTLSVRANNNLGATPGSATPGSLVINGGTLLASLDFTLSANRGLALGPTSGSGGGTINVAASKVLTYGGIAADNGGTGSLTKTGAGQLTLSGPNTYSGATTISAGTLSIGSDGNLGTAPGSATVGHLVINGGTLLTSADITLSANRGLALGPTSGSGGGTINVPTSKFLNYGGIVANNSSGTGSLTKTGAGELILSGINTYTGNTTNNNGRLQGVTGGSLASAEVILNAATATNSVSITDNTKGWTNTAFTAAAVGVLEFDFGAFTPTVAPLQITGAATFTATPKVRVVSSSALGIGTYPLMTWGSTSGTAPTTADLTVTALQLDLLAKLAISGTTLNLVIVKNVKADNSDPLNQTSSWTDHVPSSSEVALWDNTVSAANTTNSLGADTAWGGLKILNPGGAVTINAGNTLTLGAAATDIDLSTATNDLILNCALALGAANVWDVTNSRTLTVGGAVTGDFGITKQGAGTAILSSGANAYTGATAIREGTVQAGADNALPTDTALTLGNSATVGALDLATYNQTIASLLVASTNDVASTNLLLIGAGKTLTLTNGLTVGISSSANTVTKLSPTGAGTLNITGGNLQVGGSVASGVGNAATLDLSGLPNFSYNNSAGTFRVGDAVNASGSGAGSSTVILAATNTITANNFTVNSPAGAAQLGRLGSGVNSINADTIQIGAGANSSRSSGTLDFNTGTGSLTVRDTAGSGRANMAVGYASANTGVLSTNVVDLAGHPSDLLLGSLQIAGRTGSTSGAYLEGRFSFDAGTLDATSVIVGDRRGTAASPTGAVIGTLNLGGGTVTLGSINLAANTSTTNANTVFATNNISGGTVTITNAATSITLGSATSALGGGATAVLNLTGGTLTVAGNIVKGSAVGAVTSLLNLNGASAILDLGGNDITGLTGITFTDGTITNLGVVNTGLTLAGTGSRVFGQGLGVSGVIQGEVSGSGVGLTKTGDGTLTLTGTNSYDGATLVSAGKLGVLSTNASTGAVTVSANATLGVSVSGTDQWAPAALTLADPCTLEFNNLQNPGTTIAPLAPSSAVGTVSGVTINVSSLAGAAVVGYSYPLLGSQDGTTNGYTLGTQPSNITGYLTNSGSTLVYVVVTSPDVWAGVDSVNPTFWDIATSTNWTGGAANNTPADTYTNGDIVVFEDTFSPASPVTVALQTNVSPGGVIFANTTKEYIVTASGTNTIDGSGGLTKSGTNTVTLAGGTHTYSGGTTISAGTLQLGDGTTGNDATINNTSGVTNNGALVFNRFGSTSYGGTISGSGTVVKLGAGTQTLFGANGYTGGTTINEGTLQLSGSGTPGPAGASVAVSTNALLDLNGTSQTLNLTAGTGTGTIANNSGGGTSTLILADKASTNGSLAIIKDYTTPPGGTVAVTIVSNTQAMSTENTYSGGTTVNAGAFLYVSTGGSSAGTGKITLTATNSGLLANGYTISNDITGAGYVNNNVAGAATITLTGTLTNTGNYTFRNAANVYDFAGNGTTSVLSGVIGGAGGPNGGNTGGSIIKSGNGLLTLTGTNLYTGATTISGGTLTIGGSGKLGTAGSYAGNITNDAIFDYSSSSAQTLSGAISGAGVMLHSGPGTLTLSGNNTYSGGTTNTGTGVLISSLNTNLNSLGTGGVFIDSNATNQVNNVNTANAAASALTNTFTGSGLLKINFAANTTARQTLISNVTGFAGTIQLANLGTTGDKWNASSLGTVPGSLIVDSGSTFYANTGSPAFTGGITLNGAGNSEGRGAIRLGAATLGGNISLASSSTINMDNAAAVLTGNISSSAAGAQTLTLGGTGSTGGLISGNISDGTGTLTITQSLGAYTLSGDLSHSGGINVTGSALTLSGTNNTYTGVTTIGPSANRAIIVTTNNALGATGTGNETTIVGVAGATGPYLRFLGGVNYTAMEKVSGSGWGDFRGFIQGASGSNTFAGNIELSADGNSRIGTQNGAQLTLTGAITQGSGITTADILFRVGANAGDFVTLANANNSFGGDSMVYSDSTNGNWAGLRLGVDNAHPTNLTIANYTNASGNATALDLNGKNQTLNGLINGGLGTMNIINLDTVNASTLTLNPTADKSASFRTPILGGGGLGVINLVKDGAFTQTLAGTNTYTGDTTISSGALELSLTGQIANSPIIDVQTGAQFVVTNVTGGFTLAANQALKGNGTVDGQVTIAAGGILAPGASIGTLTSTTNPILGGTVLAEINATNSPTADKLVVTTGTLTYGGTLVVTNLGSVPTNGTVFDLFDAPGFAGSFASVTAGQHWNTNNLVVDGTIAFTNTAPVAASFTNGVAVGGSNTTEVVGKYASDADGDALTLAIGFAPTNGTATVVDGTNITYVSTNSMASDSFTYTVNDGFTTSTGTVTVTTYNPEGFNQLSPPIVIGLNTVALSFLGIPNEDYALEHTTNLVPPIDWSAVITNTAATNGYLNFTNTSPALQNFYRTRYVP